MQRDTVSANAQRLLGGSPFDWSNWLEGQLARGEEGRRELERLLQEADQLAQRAAMLAKYLGLRANVASGDQGHFRASAEARKCAVRVRGALGFAGWAPRPREGAPR